MVRGVLEVAMKTQEPAPRGKAEGPSPGRDRGPPGEKVPEHARFSRGCAEDLDPRAQDRETFRMINHRKDLDECRRPGLLIGDRTVGRSAVVLTTSATPLACNQTRSMREPAQLKVSELAS